MGLQFELKLKRGDFNFDVSGSYDRHITAVFGPSGAGKTTLIRLLAGLIKPDSGKIILNDRVLTDTDKKTHVPVNKRAMGIVFQDQLLFPHMTVKQNLCFGAKYTAKKTLKLEEVVKLLGLSDLLDCYPGSISGGEQQRTAIGRALMCAPEILLLDEPFNAVDYSLRSDILMYLKRLRDQLDIPMIVISHDPADLKQLADTVQLIRKGRSGGYGNILKLTDAKIMAG